MKGSRSRVAKAGGTAGVVAVVALGLVGCELAEQPAVTGNGVCGEALTHVPLPRELEETSGIAASRTHAGVFWTHNDSGGEPLVFAVDSAGRVLTAVRVAGATNRDWEDIALGPCGGPDGPDGSCLFVGETGDNSERHDRVVFYRIPEPDPRNDTVSPAAAVIGARYPDGPRDAEAVFVTAAGIHVINKGRSDAIELFRLAPPYDTTRTSEFRRLQQIAPPPTSHSAQITAAAVSADGRRVAVRSYGGLRFFTVDGDTLAPRGRPADVVVPDQMQGEGVAWIDTDRLVLTSESRGPQPASIATVRCDPDAPADTTPSDAPPS